jgi:hypothetical protein
MSFPISFENFKNSPTTALAFLLLIVVGYLYVDNKLVYKDTILEHKQRIEKIENDNKELENKIEVLNQKLIQCLNT